MTSSQTKWEPSTVVSRVETKTNLKSRDLETTVTFSYNYC